MQPLASNCLIVAMLLAGCLPGVDAQSATGRLRVTGTIQASFRVEAKGENYTSIGEGTAEGARLRATVHPGPVAVRVLKANSSSKTYSLELHGSKETLTLRDLLYDTAITAVIPDSDAATPLVLYVIPD